MEPDLITQTLLQISGYGHPATLTTIPPQQYWKWDTEKISLLTEEELTNLIQLIAWN